ELSENVAEMRLYRDLRDEKPRRDLGVGQPSAHQLENLQFATAERPLRPGAVNAVWRTAKGCQHTGCHRQIQPRAPLGDGCHRLEQIFTGRILELETTGAGAKRR